MKLVRCYRFVVVMLALCCPMVSSAVAPLAPANIDYAIYSDTAAELFWERTTNTQVMGYEITKNGVTLGVFDALSYFDDTLNPGIDYTFTITAIGVDGARSSDSSLTLRTPQYANTIATLEQETSDLEIEVGSLESLLNAGIRSPVSQTGQLSTHLPGDDGDVGAGVVWPEPRFTLNVNAVEDLNGDGVCDGVELCNGSVTDHLTGLVWLQQANCFGLESWTQALLLVSEMRGDGSQCGLSDGSEHGDWRVPNVKEFLSVLDYGQTFPHPLLPIDHPFLDVQVAGVTSPPARYWSSTAVGSSSSSVYSVSIAVGWVERAGITSNNQFTWAVRGGR